MGQPATTEVSVGPSIKASGSPADSCHRASALCARLGTARGPIVTSCWRPPEVGSADPQCRISYDAGEHRLSQDTEPAEAGQQQQQDDDDKEHELLLVHRQFIALVKLNKWQSFYLAAMMYSVINTAFIGHQLVVGSLSGVRLSGPCARLVACLLVGPLVASLVLLGSLLTVARPAHFSGLHSTRRRIPTLGLLVALLTLQVPWLAPIYLDRERCEGLQVRHPSALVLLYMVPVLVEGWPRLEQVALITLCVLSSGAQLAFELAIHKPANYLLIISLIVGCLILGLVRRRRIIHCILNRAFADAAHLVEAKASLEHQRQQQETLLLSVLPAYVAEQVKRNMVKKIESEPLEQQPLKMAAHPAVSPAVSTHLLVDTGGAGQDTRAAPCNNLLGPSPSFHQAKQGRSRSITSFPTSSPANAAAAHHQDAPNKRTSGGSFLWRLPAAAGLVGEFLNSSRHESSVVGSLPEVQVPLARVGQWGPAGAGPHCHSPHPLSGAVSAPAGGPAGHARRGFNELYIRTYNNVSLLYGDIVGFTKLSTKLSSSQLVSLLNDLFSQFDHLAERHRIMRIKILGDCYYGVSGIPEFAVTGSKSPRTASHTSSTATDNHAINCVNMGLDMIQYIWQLNAERTSRQQARPAEAEAAADAAGQMQQQQQPEMPAFELNMRIGIHTGHIHSGVIGLKKWQFDIWSNDVSIAVHCESSGVAGRVQVTQATAKQLDDVFTLEPASGCHQDPFLSARDIKTFLIRGRARLLLDQPSTESGAAPLNKHSLSGRGAASSRDPAPNSDINKIRAATIGTIRQTLLAPNTDTPDKGSWSKLAFNYHDISAITVLFRDLSLASLYRARELACSVAELCTLAILAPLAALLFLYLSQTDTSTHREEIQHRQTGGVGQLVLILSLLLALCLLLYLIRWWQADTAAAGANQAVQQLTSSPILDTAPQEITLTTPSKTSAKSMGTRLLGLMKYRNQLASLLADRGGQVRSYASRIYLMAMLLVQGHLLVSHLKLPNHSQPQTKTTTEGAHQDHNLLAFNLNQHQLTVILLLVSVDLSVDLITYTAKMVSLVGLLGLELLFLFFPLAQQHELQPAVGQLTKQVPPTEALVLVLVLWAFASARQIEFINKANFLWRNRINVDHEELEYISGINKVLLENILPSHVVQYYLTHSNETPASRSPYVRMSFSHMRNLGDELYHEQHDSVAVMFASIPHFYEFYDESDISKQGLGCIALLNEIICDFDKLLLKNKFSRIEKIKTIGSSYMAAAGLRPSQLSSSQRNSTVSQANVATSASSSTIAPPSPPRENLSPYGSESATNCFLGVQSGLEERRHAVSQLKMNLVCIIQFADSLMSALNGINKQSFQVFKLRVGVHAGSVIAGVIGAQRPFYDIWGDCVNIASRMESLGEIGRIQVEEGTAKLLMESSYAENYSIVLRGPIDVKGKGGMVTYFVDRKVHESAVGESLSPKRPNQSSRNETRRRQSIAVNHQSATTLAKSNLGPYENFIDKRLPGNSKNRRVLY